jgi:kynureninase
MKTALDPLLARRADFPILSTCTYLVSNSLGAMPAGVRERVAEFADDWATQGVVAWEKWLPLVTRVGDVIAKIINAPAGSITMLQNVSIAESVIISCLDFTGKRNKVVYSELNFPTVHYNWMAQRARGADVCLVKSRDGVTIDTQAMCDAIDERTLAVPISHVIFKSAYIQDAAAIIEKAHRVGALVVLDTYQSAGTVPIDALGWNVDVIVGGGVKWLCGGPGAAYLYVRSDLLERLTPTVVGWFGQRRPFDFSMEPDLADDIWRYAGGTPNPAALYAALTGYSMIAELGVAAIRARSMILTAHAIERAQEAGLRVNSPLDPARRGGHITVDFKGAEAACAELIRRKFIVDFRPGAGIRIGPHFYNTIEEVDAVIAEIVAIRDGR